MVVGLDVHVERKTLTFRAGQFVGIQFVSVEEIRSCDHEHQYSSVRASTSPTRRSKDWTCHNGYSLERRVSVLEMPETCVLWWTTNLMSGTTNWVPTNFPTRKLEIRVDRSGLTNVYVHVNAAFDYGREVEISIVTFASSGDGHGVVRVIGKTANSMGNITGSGVRTYTFNYDPVTKTMRTMCVTPSVAGDKLATVSYADGTANGIPNGPCTVEEWLDLYGIAE